MPSYHPSVPGPVTRPLTAANAATGNVTGVAAQVTVQGGIGTPGGAIPGNVTGVAAQVTVRGGIGTPAGVTSAGNVVNQWAGLFTQPGTLGTSAPALQSTVIALTPANSVGGGSGVPSAGSWLFCITGWQAGIAASTVGVGDDIHSFWRPGNVTTSTSAVSSSSGLTRTAVWYTPNLARVPGDIYVAPSGVQAGRACLVVEVSGIGPWDVVTGITTAYANSTRSLNLVLAAPSSASFQIAAVTGDNSLAAPATVFNPGGWTSLHTVIATNGVDHTSDAVLTAAYRGADSSAVNVSASAGTAEDLSGVIIGVQLGAPSPIPAGQNPNWPYVIFEAAFGSGFNTPADQMTWTDISSRLWSWQETTGIQFQLGQMQATTLSMELDNFDNALGSQNSASPFFPNVVAGTPLRIRAALGAMGGTSYNRWYVIQRNAQEWVEGIDEAFRRYSPSTGTDLWAALSSSGPTPYRGEVYTDQPYAWWPCDDQLLPGGVLPVTLLNAAHGNTNPLNITLSANGAVPQDPYNNYGYDLNVTGFYPITPTAVALYTVNASSGWMYGDPQSTPSSAQAGGNITASPGSAAWQVTNMLGNSGSYGWFLNCNDTSFPPLSGGVTIEGWFNASYYLSGSQVYGHSESVGDFPLQLGQPYAPQTIFEIATATAPVAILQFAQNASGISPGKGSLNLITYNGTTPTSHTIYNATDLRNETWVHFAVTLTTTTWNVLVNGGATANVSGTATGMTSAWTWFLANGDLGNTHGGSSLGSIQNGGNVQLSHLAIYPTILPAYRIRAHYLAAVTGFGLLPVPTGVAVNFQNVSATITFPYALADGSPTSSPNYTVAQVSVVVASELGSFTSGPSVHVIQVAQTINPPGGTIYYLTVTWSGVAPAFGIYIGATLNTETNSATVIGSLDGFNSGTGSGAAGFGHQQTAAGTGAAAPTSATAIGDTAAQRIERALGYANATSPARCIDPAPLLVQAALDIGGQQGGQNVQNVATSDGGMLYIDNAGNLTYWQRTHLASQYSSPVWQIGPTTSAGRIPYYKELHWLSDPQRVWNSIEIQPYSPSGASLPIITPANGAGVIASQQKYGAQPYPVNSYLQSTSEMQNQANWIFSNFGQPQRRAEKVRIDAAAYPLAWVLVLGVNIGDVIQMEDWQVGGGGTVYTYRVTEIERELRFGDSRDEVSVASVALTLDYEPSSRWS